MDSSSVAASSYKKDATRGWQALLLGRYEVGGLLGHGTFAKVHLARNVRTGESVAIKVMDKEKILKSGLIAHIQREISILRRVRHPNIVQLFEVMATKTKIYFVMEYVRGGELFNKVAKGRFSDGLARKYFQQLISAVHFCHSRGVYHRDLKPANLLLDENGDLKISDFGLSAVSDQIQQDGLFHTFCGTPAYVAPEVLARKGYDGAKVDIWSCGVILFFLMAGYLPFQDQNIVAMYKKIYKGEFRCPRWFSPELLRLVIRLLDTNPETRLTIPEIMENRWFKKGFKHIKFYIEGGKLCSVEEEDNDVCSESSMSESETEMEPRRKVATLPRPASLNAFDLISFSPGLNLSGLFGEGEEGSWFVSGAPVSKITSKLKEIAKVVSFTVKKKECRVSFKGSREGAKGPLSIAAEIFELTPSLVVIEVKKKGGERGEYEDFCNRELKLGLEKLMADNDVCSESSMSESETEKLMADVDVCSESSMSESETEKLMADDDVCSESSMSESEIEMEPRRELKLGMEKLMVDDDVCSESSMSDSEIEMEPRRELKLGMEKLMADDDVCSETSMSESKTEMEPRMKVATLPRPAILNAFDLISFSAGFNLSGLFEEGDEVSWFVSAAPVLKIISKLEEIARVASFTVRKKNFRVTLEGSREGAKGPLSIAAEIFELTPSLVVVEVNRKGGQQKEYEDFCNMELKLGLEKLMVEESQSQSSASASPAGASYLPSDRG